MCTLIVQTTLKGLIKFSLKLKFFFFLQKVYIPTVQKSLKVWTNLTNVQFQASSLQETLEVSIVFDPICLAKSSLF